MKPGKYNGGRILETAEEVQRAERYINLAAVTDEFFVYSTPPPFEVDAIHIAVILKGIRAVPALDSSTPEDIEDADDFRVAISSSKAS